MLPQLMAIYSQPLIFHPGHWLRSPGADGTAEQRCKVCSQLLLLLFYTTNNCQAYVFVFFGLIDMTSRPVLLKFSLSYRDTF